MDRLTITGMEYRGRHGCLAAERELGQRFVVDLVLGCDARRAALSDSLDDAIDYSDIYALVGKIVAGKSVNLIETLAECIALSILGRYRLVETLVVTVHKPDAPIDGHLRDVAITIERRRVP